MTGSSTSSPAQPLHRQQPAQTPLPLPFLDRPMSPGAQHPAAGSRHAASPKRSGFAAGAIPNGFARISSAHEGPAAATSSVYLSERSAEGAGEAALMVPRVPEGAALAPSGDQGTPGFDLGAAVQEAVSRLRNVRIQIRLGPSGKRLLSGAIAGGVSRTVVAPLETIRTHLMVGSTEQKSVRGVFHWILETEGWKGLFRGNGINVLRVAPSKAIELYMYDTVKKALTPKDSDTEKVPRLRLPFPASSIAGSCAGIASCTLMYPLELVKTRLTVQKGAYKGILDAFSKIIQQEGFFELYRGLFASIIGVIPYAGANYCAYDTLCTMYKRVTKKKRIGHFATLLIGSSAGAFAASATFPLEVARKQMQMGALNGRVVYKNTLECMLGILKEQGPAGLYRGLAPSCIKLVPAAGISFMCYEALKRILLEEEHLDSRRTKNPI